MPKVSVVIPAYNAEKTIRIAVDSVLQQTFKDYEIIVVDDGSTDGTRDILLSYKNKIEYVFQPNSERSAARNRGIRQSSGQYIAFLDADDFWLAEKIEKQVALLDVKPELGLVFSWAAAFAPDGKVLRLLGTNFPIDSADKMDAGAYLLRIAPPTLTVIARKDCIEEVGMFDESVSQIEDSDLWWRIALKYQIGFVPQVLAYYRLSGQYKPFRLAKCHVPSKRVYVYRKIIDMDETLPERRFAERDKQRALARAYFLGALIHTAVSNITEAEEYLFKVYDCYPEFFVEEIEDVVYMLVDFALNLFDTFTPPKDAKNFIKIFYHNLPRERFFESLRIRRRYVFETVASGHGFRAWAQGDSDQARKLFVRALLLYPDLALNRGIWSILLQSLSVNGAQDLRKFEVDPRLSCLRS